MCSLPNKQSVFLCGIVNRYWYSTQVLIIILAVGRECSTLAYRWIRKGQKYGLQNFDHSIKRKYSIPKKKLLFEK